MDIKFYTAKEVSELLKCDISTIYKAIKAGELKALHIAKNAVRISESELQDYIKRNTR